MCRMRDASAGLRERLGRSLVRRALASSWGVSSAPWQFAEFVARSDHETLAYDADARPYATLFSILHVMDLDTGEKHCLTLVPPGKAEPDKGRIPVFSPLGISLVGRRKGQMAEALFLRCSLRLVILDVLPPGQEQAP